MGSSLTVSPANEIPMNVTKNGRLVIINLQSTPLDKFAYLRINGMCEDVMRKLAVQIELNVQEFILKRMINFRMNKSKEYEFRGIDKRGVPFSFFKTVTANSGGKMKELKG